MHEPDHDALSGMAEFDAESFIEGQIKAIRETLGEEKALVACSGGVDSTVSAVLVHKAIGDNLVCVFIDDNFMRLGEAEQVKALLSSEPLSLPVRILNERQKFIEALSGIPDAEDKRKAFRQNFYATLSEIAAEEQCRYLVQGTIKADIDETSAGIKTQHNVLEQIGIDPVERYGFTIVEPLKNLYKYQVREVARALGTPPELATRQPFPGPGLSIRVVGEITPEKLEMLRAADEILIDEIKAAGLYRKISQALAVLVPVSTVGVMGDERSYENVIAIRAVETTDFMTADFSHIPYEVLGTVSSRIINEIRGVNRVVYDISSKPPATIEWE